MRSQQMFFSTAERAFAERLSRYVYLNPFFHPEAEVRYRELMSVDVDLGKVEAAIPEWSFPDRPGNAPLLRRVVAVIESALARCATGEVTFDERDVRLYDDLVMFALYFQFRDEFGQLETAHGRKVAECFRRFQAVYVAYGKVPFALEPHLQDCAHVFACLVQMRRAFLCIESLLRGSSRPTARLRAAVWNSVCPHEMRLYGQVLFDRMHDVTTLILGPSGTGKELVAAAIGLSRFIPFDIRKLRFTEDFGGSFHAVNLAALSRDLIESEMFGHCAGAFTGAVKDRAGWFELCQPRHSVFLDEIGELDHAIQVKLLRVLQSREFHRVGETEPRRFHGKLIAATNRNLGVEITGSRFRQDLYFRLCSDVIHTPSLREQLDDCPDDLPLLVGLVAGRCLGENASPEHLAWLSRLTVSWIEHSPELGLGYAWPGNFRELEQCVRNVMVRGEYHPLAIPRELPVLNSVSSAALTPLDKFVDSVRRSSLSFDELLEQYCSLVFARSGNVAEAARRLEKHRATIQSRVRPELVVGFGGQMQE